MLALIVATSTQARATKRGHAHRGSRPHTLSKPHKGLRPRVTHQVSAAKRHVIQLHVIEPHPVLADRHWDPPNDRDFVATNPTAPSRDVLDLALRAYTCGQAEGDFAQPYLTIIDYSRPSSERRLWVLDIRTKRVLFNELVAHGQNSGENFAVAFSNDPGSRQSSLGVFRTEDVYAGEHGGSLRLSGLEPGVNDLALERQIVMHGAYYVSDRHIAEYGQLGRSWGCPALSPGANRRIISQIQGGSAVFAYYPDPAWLRSSRFLHCNARLAQR